MREAAQTVKASYWAEVDETQFDLWIGGRSYANRAVAYDAIRGLLSLLNDPTTRFLMPGQVQALLQELEERSVKSLGLTEVLRRGWIRAVPHARRTSDEQRGLTLETGAAAGR